MTDDERELLIAVAKAILSWDSPKPDEVRANLNAVSAALASVEEGAPEPKRDSHPEFGI